MHVVSAIYISMALAVSHNFWYVVISFPSSSVYLFLFPLRLLWPRKVCCLIYKCLEICLLSFCYWFPVWFHCGWRSILYISSFLNVLMLISCSGYGLSWYMFHGHLKKMYIPILLFSLYFLLFLCSKAPPFTFSFLIRELPLAIL